MSNEQKYVHGSVAFLDVADDLIFASKEALLDAGKSRAHAGTFSEGVGRTYSGEPALL
jgi:hypothetical protein